MLRRVLRRTALGKRREVFRNGTTSRMLGLFGVDPAGNVLCFPMYKAGPTAGSWSVVAHDAASYPMHWWAVSKRERAGNNVDVYDRTLLCRSHAVRYCYKFIRMFYLLILGYCVFAVYLLAKQNFLNLEARIVLSVAEKSAVDTCTAAWEGAALPTEAKSAFDSAGRAVRQVVFAIAEDTGFYSPEIEMEDQIAMKEKEREAERRQRLHTKEQQKHSTETKATMVRWAQAVGAVLGCAAVILVL